MGVTVNLSGIGRTYGPKHVVTVIALQTLGWIGGTGIAAGVLGITDYLTGANLPALSTLNAGFIAGGVGADAAMMTLYPAYTSMGWGQFYWVAVRPVVVDAVVSVLGHEFPRGIRPRVQFNRDIGGNTSMGDPLDRLVPFRSAAQGPGDYRPYSGAEKAIDGDVNGKWIHSSSNTVTHTQGKDNVWWSGDLGAIRLINRVVIHNRTDCCSQRLKGVSVIISNESLEGLTVAQSLAHESVTYIHKIENNARTRGKVPIYIQDNVYGRFVKIQRNIRATDVHLNLAEVQVYSRNSDTAGKWKVKTAAVTGIDTLAAAQTAINTSTLPETYADILDFHDGGGGTGHYHNNYPFPNAQGSNGVVLQAEGEIYIPKSGKYTFGVNSDDGASITVAGTEVVRFQRSGGVADKLGVKQLAKGYHTVKVLFYDGGGSGSLEVFMDGGDKVDGRTVWDADNFHLLTSSAGTHTWAVIGVNHTAGVHDLGTARAVLKDAVDNGQLPVESDVINFNEGGNTGKFVGSTGFPGVSGNHFVIGAKAQVYIHTAGSYMFGTNSDDGVELWVDDQYVIYDDSKHGALSRYGSVVLDVGIHDIEVRYFETTGGANLEVFWSVVPAPVNNPNSNPDFQLLKSITGKPRSNVLQ